MAQGKPSTAQLDFAVALGSRQSQNSLSAKIFRFVAVRKNGFNKTTSDADRSHDYCHPARKPMTREHQ